VGRGGQLLEDMGTGRGKKRRDVAFRVALVDLGIEKQRSRRWYNITRIPSTGQRAMAVAMLSPEPEQGKRTDLTTSGEVRISQQRIADARAVLLGGVNRARTMLAFANRCHSRTT
jgi:hypothetical protein